jgi:pimeloyl-ACP methyl ester carboxylesterase
MDSNTWSNKSSHAKGHPLGFVVGTVGKGRLKKAFDGTVKAIETRDGESVPAELLPTISTPTQIIAGDADSLVPRSNNQYFDDRLPNSEAHKVDADHHAWKQAPDDYGRLVAVGPRGAGGAGPN